MQAVDGAAGSEAIQILSILSQQEDDVRAALGSAGAAKAIVTAVLTEADVGAFASHG